MTVLTIAHETFTLLRRHKVFVPMFVMLVLVAFVASLAMGLAVDEFRRIFLDVGFLGFHSGGVLVAIFWGAKLMTDSRQDGAIEVQLAAPISRASYIIGRYVGLVASLLTMAVMFVALWQLALLGLGLGWFTAAELATLALLVCNWLIVAALVVLVSCFASLPVVMFVSMSLWIAGLLAPMLERTSASHAIGLAGMVLRMVSRYWNLRLFSVGDLLATASFPAVADIAWRVAYAAALVGLMLCAAIVIFSRRSLIR